MRGSPGPGYATGTPPGVPPVRRPRYRESQVQCSRGCRTPLGVVRPQPYPVAHSPTLNTSPPARSGHDFIERVVDSVCRSVNLNLIDEQGVAAAVRMAFAALHVGGYHIVKATPWLGAPQ
jgi:hypothetical protein